MCGIAGFLDPGSNRGPELMRRHIIKMTNALAHRGPDDEGAWVDPRAGVALGNRRLAIIDLSRDGHQPMHSASGRYVITYNGEIYNSAAITRTLESAGLAPRWRGHSDTEVILAAIEAWGLDRALESFNGMFAFRALGCPRANTVPGARSTWRKASLLRLASTAHSYSLRN